MIYLGTGKVCEHANIIKYDSYLVFATFAIRATDTKIPEAYQNKEKYRELMGKIHKR